MSTAPGRFEPLYWRRHLQPRRFVHRARASRRLLGAILRRATPESPGIALSSTYDAVCASHRWQVPAQYNIAADVCDKHPRDKQAMIWESFDGSVRERTMWIIFLAILALIVFWLLMRFWRTWHSAPSDAPQHVSRITG